MYNICQFYVLKFKTKNHLSHIRNANKLDSINQIYWIKTSSESVVMGV